MILSLDPIPLPAVLWIGAGFFRISFTRIFSSRSFLILYLKHYGRRLICMQQINRVYFYIYLLSDASSSNEAVHLQQRLRSLSTELVTLRNRLHVQGGQQPPVKGGGGSTNSNSTHTSKIANARQPHVPPRGGQFNAPVPSLVSKRWIGFEWMIA